MLVNVGLIRGSRRSGLLVQPGFLSSSVTYTRTGIATGTTTSNNLYEVAANFPRFNADNELIWEGSRTNSVQNPRANGASGATGPDLWFSLIPAGCTGTFTRTNLNGVDGVEVALSGTTNASTSLFFSFQSTTPVAASGQTWNVGFWAQELAGVAGITSLACQIAGETDLGVFVEGSATNFFATRSTFARPTVTYTMANVLTTRVRGSFGTNTIPNGTNLSGYRLFIGLPQIEQGAFISSAILPPVSTSAVSTRGADTGQFNVTPAGAFVFAMRPGQAAPTSTFQTYLSINDGGDGNRWEFGCQAASNNLILTRVVGGTGNSTPTAGTQVPGGMVIGVFTWDSAGNGAVKVQGGTYRTSTSGPTGMISGRLGNRISGASALFGGIAYAEVLPNRYLSEAEMDTILSNLILTRKPGYKELITWP